MSDEAIRAQLARAVAAANVERAAERFAAVLAAVRQGDASQDLLRARRAALLEAAVAYCAAHGHPPPAGAA
jgi:hypothetical protein